MLNYMAAELYKLGKKRSLYGVMALLLSLVTLLCLPGFLSSPTGEARLSELELFLEMALPVGLLLAPVFAALVFDGQNYNTTLKNEIVAGIPRSRIYLGKLLAAALAGSACAGVTLAWYGGCILAFLSPTVDTGCATLLPALAIAWLSWLAALSFSMLLLFTLRSAVGAMAVSYVVTLVGMPAWLLPANSPPWLNALLGLIYSSSGNWLWDGERGFFVPPGQAPLGLLLQEMGISLLWIVGAAAVGVILFEKKEIK